MQHQKHANNETKSLQLTVYFIAGLSGSKAEIDI